MQLCPGFARQCALETAWVAPSPHNTPIVLVVLIIPIAPIISVVPIILIAPVILIKNISCAILWNNSVLGVRGPILTKKPRKKVRKNLAVDEKGRTFALAFRKWRRRHASRGTERLKSVKRCRTFWQRQKSAVTLQTLSGRKNAFRDTRKNEHIERITIDK